MISLNKLICTVGKCLLGLAHCHTNKQHTPVITRTPSSQQLWSAGFFLWPALRYGTGYQTVWEIRSSAETSSSVHWRRFYFQLTCVH